MLDLSFHAALPDGAWYTESLLHAGVWMWMPKYCLAMYPPNLEHINQLTEADWLPQGTLGEALDGAVAVLVSQLGQVRLLGTDDQQEQSQVWIPRADYDQLARIPVLLAFPLAPAQAKKARRVLPIDQFVPPTSLGEIGLIIGTQGDKMGWIRCPIKKLPNESQQLQQRMGAALLVLASARLERAAWLEQWKELQGMARKLAADYWRAHQDSQVERPKPINIWKIQENGQASTLAPLTMIQDGAHAAIYHKNNLAKWERQHMINDGPHQGLMVNRYIHTHGQKKENSTEFWMWHPHDAEKSNDPELVSQELMRYQAKLDDLNCDLSMLVPVYLLAVQQEEVYISPEQLLKDLDIAPKYKDGYSAGYRPEELQRVTDAFENMARFNLKTRQWIQKRRGVKPALVTAESPYLVITERIWQEPLEEGGPRRFLGWKYQIPWLSAFTSGDTDAGRQLGQLLKKSFAYRQDQRWEKRLARYLTIHLNVAAHKGQRSINCINRHVLEQCGLMPTERDRARPAEYTQQFKRAMDNLKGTQIVGDWKSTLDETTLPPRAWLDLWLDSSFRVTHSPIALLAGYQKMIDARQPHEKRE